MRRTSLEPAEVLLLATESRTALAAARSFAAHRIPFAVASVGPRGLLAASRSVQAHVVAPDPLLAPEAFIAAVLDLAEETGARLAIATHDSALHTTVRFRDTLAAAGVQLAAAPTPAVENVLDKRANLATAIRLGIPVPASFELESTDDVPGLIEELGFPLVLKPAVAGPPGSVGAFPYKWLVVRDESALRAALEGLDVPFPLCQELLRGTVVGVYCFAVRGEVVALHASIAVRRAVGQNVLRTIVPLDPELEHYARSMLGELAWDGPAALAFFVTGEGRVAYMETNGRFWGSLEGSIRAGWDFPSWTLEYFRDGRTPDAPPIALGTRHCWRAWDLIALACVLRREAWLTDRDAVHRGRAVLDYLSSFRPGVHADVFRLDDPLPELVEHWQWLRPTGARVLSRTRRAVARPAERSRE